MNISICICNKNTRRLFVCVYKAFEQMSNCRYHFIELSINFYLILFCLVTIIKPELLYTIKVPWANSSAKYSLYDSFLWSTWMTHITSYNQTTNLINSYFIIDIIRICNCYFFQCNLINSLNIWNILQYHWMHTWKTKRNSQKINN